MMRLVYSLVAQSLKGPKHVEVRAAFDPRPLQGRRYTGEGAGGFAPGY